MIMKSKSNERNQSYLLAIQHFLSSKAVNFKGFSCLCYPFSGLFPLVL